MVWVVLNMWVYSFTHPIKTTTSLTRIFYKVIVDNKALPWHTECVGLSSNASVVSESTPESTGGRDQMRARRKLEGRKTLVPLKWGILDKVWHKERTTETNELVFLSTGEQ